VSKSAKVVRSLLDLAHLQLPASSRETELSRQSNSKLLSWSREQFSCDVAFHDGRYPAALVLINPHLCL
jgi:hypothetical protein